MTNIRKQLEDLMNEIGSTPLNRITGRLRDRWASNLDAIIATLPEDASREHTERRTGSLNERRRMMSEADSVITSAQLIADGRRAVGRDPSISALSDLCSAAHASSDDPTWTAQHLLECERVVRQHIQAQHARIEELEAIVRRCASQDDIEDILARIESND